MIEILTICLLAGAMLYHTLHIDLVSILIISALTSAFFFMYFLSRRAVVLGLLIGSFILLGAVTVWFHAGAVSQDFFAVRTLQGKVQSVNRELDKTVIVMKDLSFQYLVQVTMHSENAVLPGDTVQVSGMVEKPKDFVTDTGRMFPYQEYLASKKIRGLVNDGTITIVSSGSFSPVRFAAVARFYIAGIFARYVSFPIDGLIAGMLVGYEGGVPQSVSDLFRTTGVLHVLVLSGENITLLALFLSIILRNLPFKLRSFFTAIAIVLIVLISGAGVAAVRAGIMGGLALFAGLVRRNYVPFRALAISVMLFFFISPETVFADPGFHLSVLATVFMVLVMPKIEYLFYFLPKRFNIRELGMLAICVPLFMLPYTMYFSGLLASASPFANILLAVTTPFFMLSGASILAVSWLNPFAMVFGAAASFAGQTVLKILERLDTLPQLNAPPLAWWGVLASYAIFFGLLFRFEIRQFWNDVKNSFLPRSNSSGKENR